MIMVGQVIRVQRVGGGEAIKIPGDLCFEHRIEKSFELHFLRYEKPQNPLRWFWLLRHEPCHPFVSPGDDDFLAAFRCRNQF